MRLFFLRAVGTTAVALLTACGTPTPRTTVGPSEQTTSLMPSAGGGAGGGAGTLVLPTSGAGGTGGTPSSGVVSTMPPVIAGRGEIAGGAGVGGASEAGGRGGGSATAGVHCAPRPVSGDATLHFHHVHFNSVDPAAELAFFAKFYNAKIVDFCADAAGMPTRASQTERGYFLFNKVDTLPNPELNSHLDHVGWASMAPTDELKRMMMLDMALPLWPTGDNITGQCADVAMGTACFNGVFFYTKAPSGARIEVSNSPGPSKMGFAHIHLKGPMPDFFMQVLGPALVPPEGSSNAAHVDGVNITNALLEPYAPEMPVDTKGKPIDHIAYSTGDLQATYDRIKAAGIMIQDEIAMRPEYGFRSFFVKSPQGIWVEIVEDSAFKPQP